MGVILNWYHGEISMEHKQAGVYTVTMTKRGRTYEGIFRSVYKLAKFMTEVPKGTPKSLTAQMKNIYLDTIVPNFKDWYEEEEEIKQQARLDRYTPAPYNQTLTSRQRYRIRQRQRSKMYTMTH